MLKVTTTALVFVAALACASCDMPSQTVAASAGQDFVELHKESWGSWRIYVLTHVRSGECFVSLEPSGDGGGSFDPAPKSVCASYQQLERPKSK